jgi:hypothetical protein
MDAQGKRSSENEYVGSVGCDTGTSGVIDGHMVSVPPSHQSVSPMMVHRVFRDVVTPRDCQKFFKDVCQM